MQAVEISSVHKAFGPTIALGGCSLNASKGEIHAIVGGNGSGKSTLAKVISGVLIPDSGQVSILGKTPTSPVEAKKIGIANVFQEVLVADSCTVLDNLYIGADKLFSFSMSKLEKSEKAHSLMRELLGFDLDLTTPLHDLPLSIKQWVTIGRAILSDPKVLILDESSAALDYDSTERLFRKIRQIRDTDAVVFIVTHRIAELVRIADKATVLRDGVDVGCLDKQDIDEEAILDLIAGVDRKRDAPVPSAKVDGGKSAVLKLAGAKVWPTSQPFSFDLYPGEIVGVTGLDGQGQTDFVREVSGVQPLFAGSTVYHGGEEADEIRGLKSALRNHIIYVTGDRKKEGIFPNLSIFENVMLPVYQEYRAGGVLNFINRTKLDPVFKWESEKLEVKMGSDGDLITSLSGGNQQKVLIARAFAEKPNVLVLNDPTRGVDVGAKLDLYKNLREFAASGKAVIFLSSEIEEFLNLCTRVIVFRNGTITQEFPAPFDANVILNATFGRAARMAEQASTRHHDEASAEAGTPAHGETDAVQPFKIMSPAFADGGLIPDKYVEESRISPPLAWSHCPPGTRSFAVSVTDPDLPEEFEFPRAFVHWLIYDIPPTELELEEGAGVDGRLPRGARELENDFVTFGIPGYGRGYGAPWPPDRSHRYVFTVFALKADRLDIDPDGDFESFSKAVLPVTISAASLVGCYGPAKKPLPNQEGVDADAEA